MPSTVMLDKSISSKCSESVLSELSIGKDRAEDALKIVRSHTHEIREELTNDVSKKINKAHSDLVKRVNAAIEIDGKPIYHKSNPNHPPKQGEPKDGTIMGYHKNMLGDVYSGIDPKGEVRLWYDNAPEDVTVLFVAKKSNHWKTQTLAKPNLSTNYFDAIRAEDKRCSEFEQMAFGATKVLSGFEPREGFSRDELEPEKANVIDDLRDAGEIMGSLPGVFVNYLDGSAIPMELYVSKGKKREYSTSDERGAGEPKYSDEYCVIDPITETRGIGKTLPDALKSLSQSGYYPPGAIFCQSATSGFKSSFEKGGVIGSSTVVKSWMDTGDTIAGGLGFFSMGCMLAAPETGGVTGAVGLATGIPAMGWFSFRAVQHFVKKYWYKDKVFDPTNTDDWREAGMLAVMVMAKGRGGAVVRAAGLTMMAGADIYEFHDQYSKLDGDKKKEFLLKRSGQLAASLAMNIYFGKRELGGLRVKKISKIAPEDVGISEAILSDMLGYQGRLRTKKSQAIPKSEIEAALPDIVRYSKREGKCPELLRLYPELAQELSSHLPKEFKSFSSFVSFIVERNIPPEIVPKLNQIHAELSKINGKPYDFKNEFVPLEGQNPVFAATMSDGSSVIVKMMNCAEDAFAINILEKAGIQSPYKVTNHDGFAIIERVPGVSFEDVLTNGYIPTGKGVVNLTPEIVSGISYEMGRQMAAHYAFSIPDWRPNNFLVRIENRKVKVDRIDFEDLSTGRPKDRTFKHRYDENWFDQAELDRGFRDGWKSITANKDAVMAIYEKEYHKVVSAQTERRKNIVTEEVVVAEIKSRLDIDTEEALSGFMGASQAALYY
ncbi:MAG: hypothetical protein ABIG39_07920 [Candidatus Micrarchaeota archaeon]